MRQRCSITAVVVLTCLSSVVSTAHGISRGTPDAGRHPMVAAIGATTSVGVVQGCGATLVSDTVLVTAAHCVLAGNLPPGSELRVNFGENPTPDDSGWFEPAGVASHPRFGHDIGKDSDIGVVLLAPGQSGGRAVARLPSRNELAVLNQENGLHGELFDLVGSGCHADGFTGGPHRLECQSVEKLTASAPFRALRPNWLVLSVNGVSSGEGGLCFGDSGGPQFLHETTRIMSVTSHGDAYCRSENANARLDTDTARDFLAEYVDLP